jgi:hypothetical protein
MKDKAEISRANSRTLCQRQRKLFVAISYQALTGPLHFLKDSSGTKVVGKGKWNARKRVDQNVVYGSKYIAVLMNAYLKHPNRADDRQHC